MTVQLMVTHRDHQIMHYPVDPETGWRIDAATRCVVVGKFPRTYIPMDSVLSFDVEEYGGDAPEAADEFDPPANPLERLHLQVRAALGTNVAAERKARDDGREGDALLNAARVDALDWVLQRLDEEMTIVTAPRPVESGEGR